MRRMIHLCLVLFGFSLLYADWVEDAERLYPEADAIILEDSTIVYVNPDGTGKTISFTRKGIITDKGVRDNGILSFYYDKNYTNFQIKEVALVKPDGRRIPVDFQRLAQEQTNPRLYRMNIYDTQEKVVYVPVSGLERGDIIEYRVEYDIFKVPMDSTYDDIYLIQQFEPVKHTVYVLSIPENMHLNWVVRNKVKGLKTGKRKRDGVTVYKWEARDVPPVIHEPMMPPLPEVGMRVVMSTIPSWGHVSRWYYSITEPHLKTTVRMKEVVDSLLLGQMSREDSISAIFYYVARNVRYMGLTLETNKPGFEPHDISLTFNNMYGVCRDKAALLVGMLRIAGFDAWPVLINLSFKLDEEIPVVYFNHAITAVINPDGSYTIMDPTREQARVLLPDYEMGRSFIVAKENGESLQLTPIKSVEDNLSSVVVRLDIYRDRYAGSIYFESAGILEQMFRSMLMMKRKQERYNVISGMVKEVMPQAVIDSICIEGLEVPSKPLSLRIYFHSFRGLWEDDSLIIVRPVSYINPLSAWIDRWANYGFSIRDRRYPVHLFTVMGARTHEEIVVRDDLRIKALPLGYEYVLKDGFVSRSRVRPDGSRIILEGEQMFMKLDYSLKEYNKIYRFLSLSDADREAPLILAK